MIQGAFSGFTSGCFWCMIEKKEGRKSVAQTSVDFSQGSVRRHVLAQAVPLTLAQLVQLLYNVVDRIYIGHIEGVGDLALTGLGVTFPVIVIIAAFTGLFSTGGATLFSIARGKKDEEEARRILGNVFTLLVLGAGVLFALFYSLREPVLYLFGASPASFVYAEPYLKVYLLGTLFSMLSTGLNGFISAQGFPKIGMLTTVIGAVCNIILDPIFIFTLDMGVTGAALATILSQALSALWVLWFFTGKRAPLGLKKQYLGIRWQRTKSILLLGIPGFVVQATNSLVSIACNNQLQSYGGDLYVGIMTILNSVREMTSLPVMGISHGSQPVLGYNYGAKEYKRVKEAIRFMALLGTAYTALTWMLVMVIPKQLIGIFSEDAATIETGARMLNIYFFGFVFMAFQFTGQSTFQALGKAKQAVFFSLLRKAFIVVPLTLLLPALGFGVEGVFLAEPISNAIGGIACFATMYGTVYRKIE